MPAGRQYNKVVASVDSVGLRRRFGGAVHPRAHRFHCLALARSAFQGPGRPVRTLGPCRARSAELPAEHTEGVTGRPVEDSKFTFPII